MAQNLEWQNILFFWKFPNITQITTGRKGNVGTKIVVLTRSIDRGQKEQINVYWFTAWLSIFTTLFWGALKCAGQKMGSHRGWIELSVISHLRGNQFSSHVLREAPWSPTRIWGNFAFSSGFEVNWGFWGAFSTSMLLLS